MGEREVEFHARRLAEFEHLVDVVDAFETEPVQLSPGPLNLEVASASSCSFEVFRLALQARVADRAVVQPGVLNCLLVLRPIVWCGRDVEPFTLILHGAGRETRSVMEAGYASIDFSFAEDALALSRVGRALSRAAAGAGSIYRVDSAAARSLSELARTALDGTRSESAARTSARFLALEESAIEIIFTAIASHGVGPDSMSASRSRYALAHGALEIIDQLGHEATPSGLAIRLGVTRRTLELAFASCLGVGPGRYLMARRLTAARRRLRQDEGSVLDTAFALGFQDPSRFAQHYRRHFGELPSETLRAARGPRRLPPNGSQIA